MAFTKFDKNQKARTGEIGINKSSAFTFPKGFFMQEGDDNRFFSLYYDADTSEIGFLFSKDKVKGSYSAKRNYSYGATIPCVSFFRQQGINTKKVAGWYKYTIKDVAGVGKLYVIKLPR